MLNNYEQFIRELLDPEVFGFSCSQEVQDKARELLGIVQPTKDSFEEPQDDYEPLLADHDNVQTVEKAIYGIISLEDKLDYDLMAVSVVSVNAEIYYNLCYLLSNFAWIYENFDIESSLTLNQLAYDLDTSGANIKVETIQ